MSVPLSVQSQVYSTTIFRALAHDQQKTLANRKNVTKCYWWRTNVIGGRWKTHFFFAVACNQKTKLQVETDATLFSPFNICQLSRIDLSIYSRAEPRSSALHYSYTQYCIESIYCARQKVIGREEG